MSVVFNAATAANVSILRTTNELFQISQKRVATGKRIFGAADDATRYSMSQTMLSRSRSLDAVNNNISTALMTLESTDRTLTQIQSLIQQMKDMATDALAAGSNMAITAAPTANINASTYVAGYSSGMRLSITSDAGDNFTYTFGASAAGTGSSANVTWGQVAQALNAANIGVQISFIPNGTASRLVLESTDRSTGFKIDGASSAQVVDDLTGLSSSYDGTYHSSKFANGSASPTGFATTSPYGMAFGAGGFIQAPSSMPSASANSSITFVGADGVARTWSTATTKNQDAVVAEINAMNAGVRAEFAAGGILRLRKLDGTSMVILNGSGSYAPTANGRLNSITTQPYQMGAPITGSLDNSERLRLGQQYEAYKTEITAVITNNVVQNGRNLLAGQGMNIILNEFASNPIAISGVTMTTASLGLTGVGTGWTTDALVQASLGQVQTAMGQVDDVAGQFGNYSTFVKERYDINREFSVNMKTLGDDLVAADVAEESAKLTALQTQQQFAVQAFSAGSANAQSLLRLLG